MTNSPGRIVLCFGVVDEVDIIEPFIEYHRNLGIDHFVATDVGSTDGTLDVLSRYENSGCLKLIRLQNPELDRDLGGAMLHAAVEEYRADWCMFCDADEFWVFPGDARAYLSSVAAPIIVFPRYNMVPLREAGSKGVAHFSRFDVLVRRPRNFVYDLAKAGQPATLEMLRNGYPPEILRAIAPKIIARPDAIKSVTAGFHGVVPHDAHTPRHIEAVGYLAHYPTRTLKQWRRKIFLATRWIKRNPPARRGKTANHWARYAVLLKHHLLNGEFFRQVMDREQIENLIREGILERDDTLSRRLVGLVSNLSAEGG